MTNLVRRVTLGSVLEFSPKFITKPVYDRGGRIVRAPEMGSYIMDSETGESYTAFTKHIEPRVELLGEKQNLVVHFKDPLKKIIYLDLLLSPGDGVFVEVKERARKRGEFYARTWGYNSFIRGFRSPTPGVPELKVQAGDFLSVLVSSVDSSYKSFRAVPLSKIDEVQYDLVKNMVLKL